MNWAEQIINLGKVKENSKISFNFVATKNLEIVRIKPGCGTCTFVKKLNKDLQLPVIYKPGSIPIRLRNANGGNGLPVRKTITITYSDGTEDVLTFTATVIKV